MNPKPCSTRWSTTCPRTPSAETVKVASLIIDLASEEAALVTGANIAINGGQHMR